MAEHRTEGTGGTRRRADGRRQLLVYLAPEVIKQVKKVAIDDETTASAITDEALREWLKRRVRKSAKLVGKLLGEGN